MRDEYTKLDWPSGAITHRCPLCGSKPDLYQYVEKGDALKVVMCSHGEAFGPQSGLVDEGCPFYMPPNAFYRPTIREAVKHWNEFAVALLNLRLANDQSESAVAAERKACADLARVKARLFAAENLSEVGSAVGNLIADAIEARGRS